MIPGIAAVIQRLSFRNAFGLTPAVLAAFTVAILLGFSVWPLAHEIVLFTQWLGFSSITVEQFEQAQKLIDQLRTVSPVLVVACMAVAPAVFEELFLSRLPVPSVAQSNESPYNYPCLGRAVRPLSCRIQRIAKPRTVSTQYFYGIDPWLAVLPKRKYTTGIVLHGCHNGLLMMLGYYKEELAAMGFGMEDRAHMPLGLIGLSVGTLVFGVLFIAWLPRHRTHHASQSL